VDGPKCWNVFMEFPGGNYSLVRETFEEEIVLTDIYDVSECMK